MSATLMVALLIGVITSMRLLSLCFGLFVIKFLSLLLSIILVSLVNVCPLSLFLKQESAQWHGKMELSLRNASRSNLEKNC